MKSSLHQLTAFEQKQLREMKADPRLKELYKTAKVRPLNILEKIMLKQIIAEYSKGC